MHRVWIFTYRLGASEGQNIYRLGNDGFALTETKCRETLIKAFPAPDLRCEVANSHANPCDPPEAATEMLIKSAFP